MMNLRALLAINSLKYEIILINPHSSQLVIFLMEIFYNHDNSQATVIQSVTKSINACYFNEALIKLYGWNSG